MKNQKLDRLFEKKLKNISLQPSPAAWDEIGSRVQKRRRLPLMPSVAAALSLAVALTVYFYETPEQSAPSLPVAEQAPPARPDTAETVDPQPAPPQEPRDDKNLEAANDRVNKEPTPEKQEKPLREPAPPPVVVEQETPLLAVEGSPEPVELPDEKELSAPDNAHAEAVAHLPVTITYTRSQPARSVETVSENRENTLQKFVLLAQEIKNAPIAWSELRTAKDQLLGIDILKNDKSQNSN